MTSRASGVQLGEHACLGYGSTEEHCEIAAALVADGLDRHEKVVHLDDGASGRLVLRRLDEDGFDVSPALVSGQLVLLPAEQGRLLFKATPEEMAGSLVGQLDESLAEGFAGCRFLLEVPGDTLLEQRIDVVGDALVGRPGTALWLYDGAVWPEQQVDPSRAQPTVPAVFDDGMLRITSTGTGQLRLAGEVDLCNRAALVDALEGAVDADSGLRLDLRSLRFVEVASVESVLRLAATLPEDKRVVLDGPRPLVRRVVQVCGGEDIPQLSFGETSGETSGETGPR